MRPLALLLGIVMGSTFSIALCLAMTGAVFLLMPEDAGRIAVERAPLAKAFALTTILTILAASSFYGELRVRAWRLATHAGLAIAFVIAGWIYWPDSP
jgi:hypothetical protein